MNFETLLIHYENYKAYHAHCAWQRGDKTTPEPHEVHNDTFFRAALALASAHAAYLEAKLPHYTKGNLHEKA